MLLDTSTSVADKQQLWDVGTIGDLGRALAQQGTSNVTVGSQAPLLAFDWLLAVDLVKPNCTRLVQAVIGSPAVGDRLPACAVGRCSSVGLFQRLVVLHHRRF